MQLHTRTLSAGQTLSIISDWNVLQMSVVCNPSSTGTITGDLTIGGVAPTATPLSANQGFSMSSSIANNPIQGVSVECLTGTIDVCLAVQ